MAAHGTSYPTECTFQQEKSVDKMKQVVFVHQDF